MYKQMNLCQSAQWSMGMIPALGAGCPMIISRLSRFLLKYSRNILNYNMKKICFSFLCILYSCCMHINGNI